MYTHKPLSSICVYVATHNAYVMSYMTTYNHNINFCLVGSFREGGTPFQQFTVCIRILPKKHNKKAIVIHNVLTLVLPVLNVAHVVPVPDRTASPACVWRYVIHTHIQKALLHYTCLLVCYTISNGR